MITRKLKHYFEKGQIYFVTSITKNREKIFLNHDAAKFLVVTIAYHKYVLKFLLFGYVIMPDHFHLLIQPSDEYSLSLIMKFVKGNFARKYNEFMSPVEGGSRHLSVGYKSVWQKEYYEYVIRGRDDFIEKLNYIHNNPIKQGLVKEQKEYEFSSYHQWYGEVRQKIQCPVDKILL
jgi:putative transposase